MSDAAGKRPSRLVALDFSGTLSLGATRFGRDESLVRELHSSGLWRLGVDSVAAFWDEIVNPTWQEGSTTRKGYTRLLAERVGELAAQRGVQPAPGEVRAAAARFVESYLAHSTIDPAWGLVIRDLATRPGVRVVVATDHYAEATGHIVGQLEALGLAAAPALQAWRAGQVLVANSADLGHHKATREFWVRLREAQGLGRLAAVAIVDDFGANEQPGDAYATARKVARRQLETVALLASVFDAPTRAFPFVLAGGEGAYRELVRKAGRFVRSALTA